MSAPARNPASGVDATATPLGAVLIVTFLASLGTGVFWHGISFIARHGYDFSQVRNLVLYFAMGAIYVLGAFQAGRVTRLLRHRLTPRGLLALMIGSQAVFCAGPVIFEAEWALWAAALGVMFTSSFIWPIVESYLTAGRHGPAMRKAIGWFNLTWTTAVTIPLIGMAPILEHHASWAIGSLAAVNAIALVPLTRFGRQPGHHDAGAAGHHVADEYPALLHSARILLPLSYLINSAMTPILPYRFAAIGIAVSWETPATAVWSIVRTLTLFVMMQVGFWHGRWGALLLGAVAATGGFALVVMAPGLPVVLLGLAAVGVGMGIIYYAALYYAMSVGRAEVDAGGTHEGLIGVGYTVGPLAGLLGTALGGGAAIVGSVWVLLGLGAAPAVRPYLQARRGRGGGRGSGVGGRE